MSNNRTLVNVGFEVVTFKEGSSFIIYHPETQVTGIGETFFEAKKNFDLQIKKKLTTFVVNPQ